MSTFGSNLLDFLEGNCIVKSGPKKMKKTNMVGLEKPILAKVVISPTEITKLLLSHHGFALMHIREFRNEIEVYDHRKPFYDVVSSKVSPEIPFLNPLIDPLLSEVAKEMAREFNRPAEVNIKLKETDRGTRYVINLFSPRKKEIEAVLLTIESGKVIQDESLWSFKGEEKIIALTDEDNPIILSDQDGVTVIGRDVFANLRI